MGKIISSVLCLIFILCVSVASATDIYCPVCKRLLYTTIEDIQFTPFEVEYFIPAEGVPAPTLSDDFVCPFDKTQLNGYKYWFSSRGRELPVMRYPALTIYTKDKDGNFIWYPEEVVLFDKLSK